MNPTTPQQAAGAAPAPLTLEQKNERNIWDHINDALPTLIAASQGKWTWFANSRCKYIELRIDMRDGGCIIRDAKGQRIDVATLQHQVETYDVEQWETPLGLPGGTDSGAAPAGICTACVIGGPKCKYHAPAAPDTVPAASPSNYDTLKLFNDLQDLCAEANAVDTVIGRPAVLQQKLIKMRDTVGQMAQTYLPHPADRAARQPIAPAPLTDEQVEKIAMKHEAFGFGAVDARGLTTHGFDPEGMLAFARDVEAAACAEAEPLVRQMLDALELIVQWNRDHARDQYGDPNKAETWACIRKAREVIGPAQSWLAGAQIGMGGEHG